MGIPENTKEILINAKKLIENGWTKGAFGKKGEELSSLADLTQCDHFCAAGALRASIPSQRLEAVSKKEYREIFVFIQTFVPKQENLITYNDFSSTTKEDILDIFDKAIESLNG